MKKLLNVALCVALTLELSGTVFADDITELKEKANKGNAEAQFNLGVSYVKGEGVGKDAAEAIKWFKHAAKQGHKGAQEALVSATQAEEERNAKIAEQGKKDKAHELYIDGAALVMESNKEDNEEKQKRGQDLLKRAAGMGHEAAARLLGIAQERNPTLSVSTDTLYFDAKGGTKTIAVTSNTGWGFKKYATSEETIIRHDQGKINFEGIKTGRGIEIDVKPNYSTESQQCRFYLIAASEYKGYGTETIEITVNQEGRTVHKCHACKGKGKIDQTCVACGGRVFITIPTMYGPQTRPCNFCQGKDGGVTSGKIPTPCVRCNQTGKCIDANCDGGN